MSTNNRAELRVHTKMSEMSGVSSIESYIQRADEYGLTAIAITDKNDVNAYFKATYNKSPVKIIYGIDLGVTLLAKNTIGIKYIYEIMTKLSEKENSKLTFELLNRYREGLIVGSGCNSDFYKLSLEEDCFGDLLDNAKFCKYDYLELCPGMDKEAMTRIINVGKQLNIPVCAVSNAYCCNEDDVILHKMIKNGSTCNFLYTTDEMLQYFSFLGEDKAREIVVKNTNAIADSVENDAFRFPYTEPKIQDAYEELHRAVYNKAKELYGSDLNPTVADRIEYELGKIKNRKYEIYYVTALRIANAARSPLSGFEISTRGSLSASFVAYLCGVSNINPLPPHRICPKCKRMEFFTEPGVCFDDKPEEICKNCGSKTKNDGYNVSFEAFAGITCDDTPRIDIYVEEYYLPHVYEILENIFGKDNIFAGGDTLTMSPLAASKTVSRYFSNRDIHTKREEEKPFAERLYGIKRGNTTVPGKIYIKENRYDASNITPLDMRGSVPTSLIDYKNLDPHIFSINVLPFYALDLLDEIAKLTRVSYKNINLNDLEVISAIKNGESYEIFELDNQKSCEIIKAADPHTFSELVKAYSLAHGTGTWTDNAETLIKNGVCTVRNVAASREDILLYLTGKGIEFEKAYRIMEITRCGKAETRLTEEAVTGLKSHVVPDWYIESLKKIKYMFPKAHCVEYTRLMVILVWYKLHYPEEFKIALSGKEDERVEL